MAKTRLSIYDGEQIVFYSTDNLSHSVLVRNATTFSIDGAKILAVGLDLGGTGDITNANFKGNTIGPTYGGTGQNAWTTGQMLYASAADTLSKLGIGSAGQVLVVSGGIPAWSNTIAGNITITGTLTVNGTSTTINSETLTIDDDKIILNNNSVGGADGGVLVKRGALELASLLWSESASKWKAGLNGSEIELVDLSSAQALIGKTGYNGLALSVVAGGVTGYTIGGGNKTLTLDADLQAAKAISLTGGASITVGSGTTLSAGGSVGTISINTSWVGQTGITTLGIITTGTWNSVTKIGAAYGGTGLDASAAANGKLLIGNGSGFTLATLTQGSANQVVITNAAGAITLALPQDINALATPTFAQITLSNAATTTSHAVRGDRSISFTNDTNVTASGAGNMTSDRTITLGWSGTLSLARGGTAADLSAGSQGGVVYKGATAFAVNSAGTSGQALISGGTGSPTWFSPATPTNALVFLSVAGALSKGSLTWDDSTKALGISSGSITYSTDNLTLHPGNVGGTITLFSAPVGASVLPGSANGVTLGSINKKFLSLYASELIVETLVSQDTMATLGGRILVSPTTTLTTALTNVATTMLTKHNNLAINDIVMLEAAGHLEYISISGGPTGIGPYSYTVIRNLDATGANAWEVGDAVVNTGSVGSGFIDMFSDWGIGGRSLDYIWNYNPTTTYFNANVANSNYAQSLQIPLFGDGQSGSNGIMYFGAAGAIWKNLYITVQTECSTGAAPSIVWEYWNGAWTLFTPSMTLNGAALVFPVLTALGSYAIEWGTLAGWASTTINTKAGFFVRARIASAVITAGVSSSKYRIRSVRRNVGPTIVGNVRKSLTFNDYSEHWAIGNLNGIYGYGADVYGAAFGKYAASGTVPYITVESTNGIRINNGGATIGQWDINGNITVGTVAANMHNLQITSTALNLRLNDVVYTSLASGPGSTGLLTIGEFANSRSRITISSVEGIKLIARYDNEDTIMGYWDVNGSVTIGPLGGCNFGLADGALEIRNGNYTQVTLNYLGHLVLGRIANNMSRVSIDPDDGFQIANQNNSGVTSILAKWDIFGNLFIGNKASDHIKISAGLIEFKSNDTTTYGSLNGTVWTLGATTGRYMLLDTNGVSLYDATNMYARFAATTTIGLTTSRHISLDATNLQFKTGTTVKMQLSSSDILIGETGASKTNILMDATAIYLRSNVTARITLNANGSGVLANGNITWDTNGVLTIASSAVIGGWTINTGAIEIGTLGTSGIHLTYNATAANATIALGGASALGTGTGIWMAGNGDFRAGNPLAQYMQWSGTALTVKGAITADTGTLTTLNVNGVITVAAGGSITSGSFYTFSSAGGSIAGWTIVATALYTGRTSLAGTGAGIYLGTDGISIGGSSTDFFKITTTSGTIAGWTFDNAKMYKYDSNGGIAINSSTNLMSFFRDSGTNTMVEIGNLGTNNYGLKIKNASGLQVFLADESGANIAGWDFDTVKLTKGTATAGMAINTSNTAFLTGTGFEVWDSAAPKMFIGVKAGSRMSYNSDVTGQLAIYASTVKVFETTVAGAKLGGWTVDADSIFSGTRAVSGYTSTIGHVTIVSTGAIHAKNFYLDAAGNVFARNADFTGAISANTGYIGGATGWVIEDKVIRSGQSVFVTTDASKVVAQVGTGTITSSGVTVTGAGTAFSTQLVVGSTITVAGQTRVVTVINSATNLTTDTALSPAISTGTAFTFFTVMAVVGNYSGTNWGGWFASGGFGGTLGTPNIYISGEGLEVRDSSSTRLFIRNSDTFWQDQANLKQIVAVTDSGFEAALLVTNWATLTSNAGGTATRSTVAGSFSAGVAGLKIAPVLTGSLVNVVEVVSSSIAAGGTAGTTRDYNFSVDFKSMFDTAQIDLAETVYMKIVNASTGFVYATIHAATNVIATFNLPKATVPIGDSVPTWTNLQYGFSIPAAVTDFKIVFGLSFNTLVRAASYDVYFDNIILKRFTPVIEISKSGFFAYTSDSSYIKAGVGGLTIKGGSATFTDLVVQGNMAVYGTQTVYVTATGLSGTTATIFTLGSTSANFTTTNVNLNFIDTTHYIRLVGNTTPANATFDFSRAITWPSGSSANANSAFTHISATGAQHGAVSTNTASTIVYRDGSGNFAAGTITATLSGSATTLTTSRNFSASGDVSATGVGFNGSANVDLVMAIGALKVTNGMLAGSIAYSKLVLTGAILAADIVAGAGIPYSKLTLTGAVLAADIVAAAGIPYSKLTLTGAVLNADLAGSIADGKLLQITTGSKVHGSSITGAMSTSAAITGTTITGSDLVIGTKSIKNSPYRQRTTVTVAILENIAVTVPGGYALSNNDGTQTKMLVFVNGDYMRPDTVSPSVAYDYQEFSTTQVKFHFDIAVGAVIDYVIFDF